MLLSLVGGSELRQYIGHPWIPPIGSTKYPEMENRDDGKKKEGPGPTLTPIRRDFKTPVAECKENS